MMIRATALFLAMSIAGGVRAAGEIRPSAQRCDPAGLIGRAYVECLTQANIATEAEREAALKRALDVVGTRESTFPAQRARWKRSLEEAETLWIRLRNSECQEVAPFEAGPRRADIFAARLACLIDYNVRRTEELVRRYPPS